MRAVFAALFAGLMGWTFVQPVAAVERVKYTDGQWPNSVMYVNGTLYGTTEAGGAFGCFNQLGYAGCGTVFSLDLATGIEKVLYSFCIQTGCADGYSPSADLIDIKGTLYGTTWDGGGSSSFAGGTVFSFNTSTGKQKVLHAFCQSNCSDGGNPSNLIRRGAILYGITDIGGAHGYGTVFAVDRKAGTETVVYSFCQQGGQCADGQNPVGALADVKGTLYGTTVAGGTIRCDNSSQACGTVYSLDASTGAETVIHSFGGGGDGRYPEAGLIAVRGVLYGTTIAGGAVGCDRCGMVFSVDPGTGTENVLYSFCSLSNCADGAEPVGLIDLNGMLYGTTVEGGTGCNDSGCGTVFSLNPSTGAEKVLYSFCSQANCTDGADPSSSLISVNGMLYGTTFGGGTGCSGYGCGTVYSINPATGAEKVIYAFCSGETCT